MPISTDNPRGRAANSGSKPRLGQARAADSWLPGERDTSSTPFCTKGFDFILEFLPEMGDWGSLSQGCRDCSSAEGAGRQSRTPSSCGCRAITRPPHSPCDPRDTSFWTGNQSRWLPEKKKSISNCNSPPSICTSDLSLRSLKNAR